MGSSTSVTVDFVLKQMREKDRRIFFVEDADGSVLAYSDNPELKIDTVCDKLEEELNEINGTYAYVRLHHKGGKGNGAGGKQEPLLRYKVYIGGSDRGSERRSREREPIGGGMGLGGGSNNLLMNLFNKVSDLEKNLVGAQKDAEIAMWKRKAEETKENSHTPTVDYFTSSLMKKYITYENAKQAASGKTPLADDGGKKHEADTDLMLSIIKNFSEIDPEYLPNLGRVSKYVKANPEAYFGLLTSLKENGF